MPLNSPSLMLATSADRGRLLCRTSRAVSNRERALTWYPAPSAIERSRETTSASWSTMTAVGSGRGLARAPSSCQTGFYEVKLDRRVVFVRYGLKADPAKIDGRRRRVAANDRTARGTDWSRRLRSSRPETARLATGFSL